MDYDYVAGTISCDEHADHRCIGDDLLTSHLDDLTVLRIESRSIEK